MLTCGVAVTPVIIQHNALFAVNVLGNDCAVTVETDGIGMNAVTINLAISSHHIVCPSVGNLVC